jgi:hypothetical protein
VKQEAATGRRLQVEGQRFGRGRAMSRAEAHPIECDVAAAATEEGPSSTIALRRAECYSSAARRTIASATSMMVTRPEPSIRPATSRTV